MRYAHALLPYVFKKGTRLKILASFFWPLVAGVGALGAGAAEENKGRFRPASTGAPDGKGLVGADTSQRVGGAAPGVTAMSTTCRRQSVDTISRYGQSIRLLMSEATL